jgi:hypothetical protein
LATLTDAPLSVAAQTVRGIAVDHRRRPPDPRRHVRAVDVLLGELERFNLAGGERASSPEVSGWLRHLQGSVSVEVPAWVLAMPDTVQLHAAMLRWQGLLLSAARPERDEIADLHEDPIDLLLLPAAAQPRRPERERVRRRVA